MVGRILLLSHEFRQSADFHLLSALIRVPHGQARSFSVSQSGWHSRDRIHANREDVRLDDVVQKRRLPGTDSAEQGDFVTLRLQAVHDHGKRGTKFNESVIVNDPLQTF